MLWLRCIAACVLLAQALACAKTDRAKLLRVGATAVPHQQILETLVDTLRRQEGIYLKIIPFNDYNQPNLLLQDGQLDANFYQTQAFLQAFNADHKTDLMALQAVHHEPLGIYSHRYTTLQDLPEQAVVAIPNDISNSSRALLLLAKQGLITLSAAKHDLSIDDVISNPHKLRLKAIESAMLPRILDDVDAACINTNFALAASLHPQKDALAREELSDAYANVLVTQQGRQHSQPLKSLAQALASEQVRAFMLQTYDGAILPAF